MYKRTEFGFGHAGLTASLSLDQVIARPAPVAEDYRGRAKAFFDDYDLAPDLGVDIGSRTWWRGLATCLALCGAAISLAPEYRPLTLSVDPALDRDAWEERRALAIAPLAQGGDSGKRMAASEAVIALQGTPERPSIDLSATLGQGDSFTRVLERAGVGGAEARRVAAMVGDVTPLSGVEPGTAFKITLGRRANMRTARPLDQLQFRARFDLALDIRRAGGGLVVHQMPIAVDNAPIRIQGRVGESLYRSARAAGAPAKVAEAYIRAIATKLSLSSDVYADARFDIVAERQRAETGEVRFGKLLYAGLERGSRKTQLLQWTVGGQTQWFEASGVGQRRAGMGQPVYGRVTSGFGMRRHPLLGYSRFHQGIDFGAGYGSPVYAVSPGVIRYAARYGGYGNHIRIDHGGGMVTSYSHLSRYAIAPGTRVAQGQVIGYVGSTGMSTGPHLHFEVYRSGRPVNPRGVVFASTSLLEGSELAAFRAKLRQMQAVPVSAR